MERKIKQLESEVERWKEAAMELHAQNVRLLDWQKKAVEILKDIQHCDKGNDDGELSYCPVCGEVDYRGHKKNCDIAILRKQAKGN